MNHAVKYSKTAAVEADRLTGAGGIMYRTMADPRERDETSRGVAALGRPGTCQGSFQRRISMDNLCWRSKCEEKANTTRMTTEDMKMRWTAKLC